MNSIQFGRSQDCSNSTHPEFSLPPDRDNCPEPQAPPQIPPDSHDLIDIFGEPEVSPRVGDEFQVKLPTPLEHESHSSKLKTSATETLHDHILLGYPITLTWINTLQNHAFGPNSKTMKRKALDELDGLPTEEKDGKCGGPGHYLVPGLPNVSWNALEKDSFLLGLYIFEKDFVLVRRLVVTKNMASVLAFYYGDFYHSCEYRRWSECRKAKGRKGIGQRIFSGARQQELLNRILVGVSEERRNHILEAAKIFGEDRMPFSDYVFSLMRMVGIETLVDAVGIGKGKLDLTEIPLESSRANPTRPTIPSGRELSYLKTDEIVQILRGNYRLSKARANDLFWEAVWPRLLDRGWHSEQPNNKAFSSHSLVFLTPGIKKFSRRKLVKGEHYFDSLTDILNKVAKEPELINLNSEKVKKEQREISPDEKKSEKGTHCYLQPRTPNRNTDIVKLTVVDTSLLDGKVREVRSFPSEVMDTLTIQDLAEDDGERSDGSLSSDVAMHDASMDVDLDGKAARKSDKKTTSVSDLKIYSNRTEKVLKYRKAVTRDTADHVGPTKRCRILTPHDQEEKKVPSRDVNEVGSILENAHPPPLPIDVNLAGAPPEPENEGLGRQQDRAPHGQPLNLNPRRISTRYRPPTMRTMQAVADGYLAVSPRRKGKPKRTGVSNPADGTVAPQVVGR